MLISIQCSLESSKEIDALKFRDENEGSSRSFSLVPDAGDDIYTPSTFMLFIYLYLSNFPIITSENFHLFYPRDMSTTKEIILLRCFAFLASGNIRSIFSLLLGTRWRVCTSRLEGGREKQERNEFVCPFWRSSLP